MIEQSIHQAHTTQLIDQGHVTFRGSQAPGESPGITGPDTILFPTNPRPQTLVTTIESGQQFGLSRETKPPLGIGGPERSRVIKSRPCIGGTSLKYTAALLSVRTCELRTRLVNRSASSNCSASRSRCR